MMPPNLTMLAFPEGQNLKLGQFSMVEHILNYLTAPELPLTMCLCGTVSMYFSYPESRLSHQTLTKLMQTNQGSGVESL